MVEINIEDYRKMSDRSLAEIYQRRVWYFESINAPVDKKLRVDPKRTDRPTLISIIMKLDRRVPVEAI